MRKIGLEAKACYLFWISLFVLCTGELSAQSKISLNSDDAQSVDWEVAPQSAVGKDSVKMFALGYHTSGWVKAVVPGTVFTAYVDAGLEKDPDYGDNIYQVDKSKYDRNFWYRATLPSPPHDKGEKVWLNFEGINRKGVIFFNGVRLGKLDGFMERGKYDITSLLARGKKNVLAVLVYCPHLPIPNYASPTYISSDGWDWMPPVPGLEMGITDDVYLSTSYAVTLADPWIRSKVPSSDSAVLRVQVTLHNTAAKEVEGVLTGLIQPGNITFSRKVRIGGGTTRILKMDTGEFRQLIINNPKLWWPNGYGKPNLYTCDLKYSIDGKVSDRRRITFGIRQYSYDTTGNVLHILINGKRVFIKGGNWGMSEYMLRCRGKEYDLKVKLHKAMHLNMIRNWIGSTTDEEFYAACDKYGIMVWDDFWLNSHPNLPRNIFAFNRNAVEKIKRLRNHPCIAIWCGDNEGYPLPPLNGWLAEDVKTFDGNDRKYQPNSHAGSLTGSGPWTNFDPQWYFTKYPGGFGGNRGWGFRTEIGTATFPTFSSFRLFIPKKDWWPANEMWNKHFFGKSAANAGPDHYMESINQRYGKARGIKDFCRKAQLLNIETNKALFEGWQQHMWHDASGVMLWMSQPAYPSMVWQTYDYYYDLTGAYWGVRKACEPLHIQWSYADNSVRVVNTSLKNYTGLQAEAIVYDLRGNKTGLGRSIVVNSPSNTSRHCFDLNFNTDNLAYKKKVTASSVSKDAGDGGAVTDGSRGSRWSSDYSDNQWIAVDLGKEEKFGEVVLTWETAYAKAFKLQVSDDASDWKDIYTQRHGKGGVEAITFPAVKARFIRMLGLKRGTTFGYSLYEFEVYKKAVSLRPSVQFIRLYLKDQEGRVLSDNFYWRSTRGNDYTALNTLPKVKLQVSSSLIHRNGKDIIQATIGNPASSHTIAFAVHVQAIRAEDGKRILPAFMNDNYFTLLEGETKNIRITFNPGLLKDGQYKLLVKPYNNRSPEVTMTKDDVLTENE